MARVKDVSVSQAFQQKVQAAEDKLRRFQAEQLSSDMDRLFTEGLHSDMTVELQYSTLTLHSCIIKARSQELFNMLFSIPGSCTEKKLVSMKTCTDHKKIEDLFRSLYIENDITNCLCEFSKVLALGTNSSITINYEGEVIKPPLNDVSRIQEQENQIDVSQKNGINQSQILNDPDKLYELARDIVDSAVNDALKIVHEGHNNVMLDTDETDKQSTHSYEIEQQNGCVNTCLGTSKNLLAIIKSTKEDSTVSIGALLERVCSLKILVTPSGELGEDLLRLWLNNTDCDACISINTSDFLVHRCILSCRSMYFDAMLGGSWRESDLEQIVLEGVDTGTMRQTLLYLYGGVVEVDPTCSLGGLVMMSDMYTMEGLKEVVAFNLNKDYCHFFHRPCATCIVGVPEALTLTMVYNMEAMREKCVKWINKNFGKVWPTKQFAALPQEVMDFCVTTAVKDMAMDNVIDTMVECRQLNEKIPRLKWSESILDMITRLMDAAIEFSSQNFVNIIGSKTFRNIDKQGKAFNKQPLEDIFGMVLMALSPENSCQAFMSLDKWMMYIKPRENEAFPLYSEEFTDFVKFLFKKCREHMCLYIHQVAHTVEWTYLSKESQKEIMEEANYVCIDSPNKSRMARPKLTSMQKKLSTTSHLSLKEYFDQHFGLKGMDKKNKSPSPARNTSPKKETYSWTQNKGTIRNTSPQHAGVKKKEATLKTKGSDIANRSSKKEGPKDRITNLNVNSDKTKIKDQAGTKEKRKGINETVAKSKTKVIREQTFILNKVEAIESNGLKSKSKTSEPTDSKSKTKTNAQSNFTKDPNLDNSDQKNISDELVGAVSDDDAQLIECRQRSSSFGQQMFVPNFGQKPLQSAKSTESFFDNRQGFNTIVQKPTPTLKVKFNAPLEFHESF